MSEDEINQQLVLDKALALAHQSSWESFSLLALAKNLNCSLSEIRRLFRSKDDMAEALFDRADAAMLNRSSQDALPAQTSDQRLVDCIMVWFNVLSPDKKLVKEILAYKFEPGHFHLQAHGITRVSRTVQWFIQAAGRDYSGLKRIGDEISVTSAYLLSFSFYFVDNSKQHIKTRQLLQRLLNRNRQLYHAFKAISRPIRHNK
ncbi:hypothetical protein A9Q98_12930 [Thalassotalea sp. 42_200_T64]|nr:hypothetical protein A9Q98_12930 [Thalassotalea sp. 42_200_T64]